MFPEFPADASEASRLRLFATPEWSGPVSSVHLNEALGRTVKWGPNKRWDCQPEFGWNWERERDIYIYRYNNILCICMYIYIYICICIYIYIYFLWTIYFILYNKLHDHLNKHTNELQGGSIAASTKTKSSSNKACVETHEYMIHTLTLLVLQVGGFNHLEKYESQWEGLSHILWKIKNVWNHQPD